MASVITELDQFDASVIRPDDGDTSSAASISAAGVGLQPLANRTNFLKKRSAAADGGNLLVTLNEVLNSNSRFSLAFGVSSPDYSWVQSDITDAGGLWFRVPPLYGVEITDVLARVHGDGGGVGTHGALPATMPAVTLFELDSTSGTGTVNNLGSQSDVSANVAAYETIHDITLTGLNAVAGDESSYLVRLAGEAGANSLVNRLTMYRILLTLSPV